SNKRHLKMLSRKSDKLIPMLMRIHRKLILSPMQATRHFHGIICQENRNQNDNDGSLKLFDFFLQVLTIIRYYKTTGHYS
ncbi:hypothetical protein L9F63_024585, partial [Diploptera punctata]